MVHRIAYGMPFLIYSIMLSFTDRAVKSLRFSVYLGVSVLPCVAHDISSEWGMSLTDFPLDIFVCLFMYYSLSQSVFLDSRLDSHISAFLITQSVIYFSFLRTFEVTVVSCNCWYALADMWSLWSWRDIGREGFQTCFLYI